MLFLGTYQSPSPNYQYYFECIDKALDIQNNYDKVMLVILTQRKVETVEKVETFLYRHNLKILVKGGTCFKIPG